ncbi:ABC transporter family protein [Collimonas arenae]|uniref:ABC transporter family protein n=1 Tax=Collimonas arenae TaxID=279058 RepID=A0A127QGP8_9BURK|nr:ABC transporter ATP-binding protein [Collimonas arenae]AMO99316.1 ABC transporter family protein [Collimonas arenae]AMP09220.1 ABC transporter family protein [Collimonas arenae]
MIKISGLTFDYPGHRALHQVSLQVEQGSVTALVGSNGAGKTTLMRCIAGLETPLAGAISVAGMDVLERPREAHRLMGYLSDFYGLYQALTVSQCLEYAAAAQGLPAVAIPQAIRTTAQQLALTDRLQQTCDKLSRGLRQRVAIGQAIIHAPKVLLLDEPASGLDPEARSSLAGLFRQLQASGMTLLVSSHILAELDEYSTHMLALRDGRVLEYRALKHDSGHPSARKSLRIVLAQANAGLHAQLAAEPTVQIEGGDERTADFLFSGDEHAQAALLARLIGNGLAVASLSDQKENLQQSYLRSVATYENGQQHLPATGGSAT